MCSPIVLFARTVITFSMSAPPEKLAINKSSEPADAATINTDTSRMVHESSQRPPHVSSNDNDIFPIAEPLYTSVKRLKSDYADGSEARKHPEVCCNKMQFVCIRQKSLVNDNLMFYNLRKVGGI